MLKLSLIIPSDVIIVLYITPYQFWRMRGKYINALCSSDCTGVFTCYWRFHILKKQRIYGFKYKPFDHRIFHNLCNKE